MSQVSNNPFKNSDTNKRYYTYDYYLKKEYGEKCAKIPLSTGLSCPNIDGTKGVGGCIYCLGGSLSSVCEKRLPISEQYRQGIAKLSKKWSVKKFIPYFQSYSNTHTSPDFLRKMLKEASELEGACEIDIATRADCINEEIAKVINEFTNIIPITVELGLQSANDKTAEIINRCHTLKEFEDGFNILRKYAPKAKISVHIINGLPGEDKSEMLKTADYVSIIRPDFIKIHLLLVLSGTKLERTFNEGKYVPMSREDYIDTVCAQIEIINENIVLERLCADSVEDMLVAPEYAKKKVSILNDIDKELFKRDTYQGKFSKNGKNI